MVIPIHRLVQQPDPWHRLHGIHQRTHRRLVSSLTEVRHTFDDSVHELYCPLKNQNNEAGGLIIIPPASLSD